MTISSSLVLWFTTSLLNAGGVLAAAHAWNTRFSKKHTRLIWLVPAVFIAAWLASFFGAPVVAQAISLMNVVLPIRALATNLLAYFALGLVFLLLRRAALKRTASAKKPETTEPISNSGLRQTVESFLSAADTANVDRLAATYAPDFLCIRVADAGGFAQLTAEQMLSFMRRAISGKAVGHAVPTKTSTIHHAEILGDSAIVLVTRMKDLGNGWEPLFYTLIWQRANSTWHLQREIVHQKSAPNWT
ncbi:MAG TPA: nuclear transport factor 2 family protein [Candidatus Dormibacteraeota bacterium]|jgi:hypothetical protein|nr:nuclear transport factor 2 family protein [Candidatus Dormibacteraeota bacterium]